MCKHTLTTYWSSRETLEDNLAKLKILKKMHDAGLKITAAKSCLYTYKSNI